MKISLGCASLLLALAWLPAGPTAQVAAQELPYTFFFTRYQLTRSADRLEAVRYNSDGQPFAKAPDGSSIALSGRGAWEPGSRRAEGGGRYAIKGAAGTVTADGAWHVTGFVSFEKLPGWWGIPGLREEGWQGPPGSVSFSGFLTLTVHLEGRGEGTLVAWCLMPDVPKPGDRAGDGISLSGGPFDFTDYRESVSPNGVMFYSSDPADEGYALTEQGTTAFRAGLPRQTTAPPAQVPRALPRGGS